MIFALKVFAPLRLREIFFLKLEVVFLRNPNFLFYTSPPEVYIVDQFKTTAMKRFLFFLNLAIIAAQQTARTSRRSTTMGFGCLIRITGFGLLGLIPPHLWIEIPFFICQKRSKN